jgi:hypothetical protein
MERKKRATARASKKRAATSRSRGRTAVAPKTPRETGEDAKGLAKTASSPAPTESVGQGLPKPKRARVVRKSSPAEAQASQSKTKRISKTSEAASSDTPKKRVAPKKPGAGKLSAVTPGGRSRRKVVATKTSSGKKAESPVREVKKKAAVKGALPIPEEGDEVEAQVGPAIVPAAKSARTAKTRRVIASKPTKDLPVAKTPQPAQKPKRAAARRKSATADREGVGSPRSADIPVRPPKHLQAPADKNVGAAGQPERAPEEAISSPGTQEHSGMVSPAGPAAPAKPKSSSTQPAQTKPAPAAPTRAKPAEAAEGEKGSGQPKPPKLPPILLEGDEPFASPLPGVRPEDALQKVLLPEPFGTGRLNILARDPHSMYAYWDLTREQQDHYNGLSADKHMVLLIWQVGPGQRLIAELPVHPESRHWFIHVPVAGGTYSAELGYYDQNRNWTTVAVSTPIQTPGGQTRTQPPHAPLFATVSMEPEPAVIPMLPGEPVPGPAPEPTAEPAQAVVAEAGWEGLSKEPGAAEPFLENLIHPQSTETGPAAEPADEPRQYQEYLEPSPDPGSESPRADPYNEDERAWTPEQSREILGITGVAPREFPAGSSIEVVDLFQRIVREGVGISSIEAMQFGLAPERAPEEAVSSPGLQQDLFREVPSRQPGFWFNVNAELVVYGSTEPDARVSIGGRPIQMRPDGSFSYRFSLPDGHYELPIRAVSSNGDIRGATLQFGRGTSHEGEVGAHPQDPGLVPPSPANIAQ